MVGSLEGFVMNLCFELALFRVSFSVLHQFWTLTVSRLILFPISRYPTFESELALRPGSLISGPSTDLKCVSVRSLRCGAFGLVSYYVIWERWRIVFFFFKQTPFSDKKKNTCTSSCLIISQMMVVILIIYTVHIACLLAWETNRCQICAHMTRCF